MKSLPICLCLILATFASAASQAKPPSKTAAKIQIQQIDEDDEADDSEDGAEEDSPDATSAGPEIIEVKATTGGKAQRAVISGSTAVAAVEDEDDEDNAEEGNGGLPPKAVEKPYYSLALSGNRAYNRNGPPDYHTNAQGSALQAVLPIGHSFGAKINAAYGLNDISLTVPCGSPSTKAGSVQGFWSNPDKAKLGASIGRSIIGNCLVDSNAYNTYSLLGEYYFDHGWIGASATYTRATAMRSVYGEDSDEYLFSGEWQPEKFTLGAHLKRLFQRPIQPELLKLLAPADRVSGNYADVSLTAYPQPDLALNLTTGQPLHYSNETPRTGSTSFSLRWQPEALGHNLEMAVRGDATHDSHGVTLGLAYYFDNKATLLVRDRELRY